VGGKTHQLQIRVSGAQKHAIQRAAGRAGMDMSTWVLSKLVPPAGPRFRELTRAVADRGIDAAERRFAFAELNAFLAAVPPGEFTNAVPEPPPDDTDPYTANYMAAMVETAAHRNRLPAPAWTERIAPLDEPVFGSSLMSLRLHLLMQAPPAFRRRNIFVDASIGAQV
jgi:hypothetical protein